MIFWRHGKATIRDTPPVSNNVQSNRGHSPSPSPHPPPKRSGTFHFTSTTSKKELDNWTVSPSRFPLVRSGSLASRPVTPIGSRPTTPNPIWPPTLILYFWGASIPWSHENPPRCDCMWAGRTAWRWWNNTQAKASVS